VSGVAIARQACDFGEMMREHRSMVFSVAYHFLHDRDLADEIAQDVFLSLHKHIGGLESPTHVAYWLRKVAVQRSIDASRKR
jgi:RNA polymerase sigma-70 factor (ECF subfamily)